MVESKTTTDDKMIDVECPECNGSGNGPTQPECCGNYYPSGECRGDCAVPVQMPCEFCGGSGHVEMPASQIPGAT